MLTIVSNINQIPATIEYPLILRGANAQDIANVLARIRTGTIAPAAPHQAVGRIIVTPGFVENYFATYDGETLQLNDLILRGTKFGDGDLDGNVTPDDYNNFLDGYNGTLQPCWLTGDYNGDGDVDTADKALFDANYPH